MVTLNKDGMSQFSLSLGKVTRAVLAIECQQKCHFHLWGEVLKDIYAPFCLLSSGWRVDAMAGAPVAVLDTEVMLCATFQSGCSQMVETSKPCESNPMPSTACPDFPLMVVGGGTHITLFCQVYFFQRQRK